MDAKLTLTIGYERMQTIENYAKKRGYTLSGLVENYFSAIIKSEEVAGSISAPIANSLLGSLKAPDKADYKKELENALEEKYL
jgi:hypothetical protein